MKTDTERSVVPRAQRDVWAWKESVSREVKGLPLPQALHKIMDMARTASASASYTKHGASPATHLRVAEERSKYRKR